MIGYKNNKTILEGNKMKEIKKVVEIKNGKTWEVSFILTDEKEVYESLAQDLINKKLNQCTFIKTIKRIPNYDGTQSITVNYNNDTRAVYTVKN